MERIGVSFAGGLSPTEIVECVKVADELGYDSAWMAEAHGGDHFSILTACAMVTRNIRLGTNVSSVFVRSAPTIAMAAACVDHYSNGRFVLGLGSSHRVQVGPEHGQPYVRPLQRLRETVDIIRTLLRDGEVSYKGGLIDIERFDFWFQPLRREIPIYLAAVFPKMLQVSGEIADGVLLASGTVEQRREAVENIAIGATTAGRDPRELEVGAGLPCIMSSDKKKGRDAMRDSLASTIGFFPRYRRVMAEGGFHEEVEAVRRAWSEGDRERATRLVPDGLVDAYAVVGSPDDFRERIQEYRKVGVTLPIVSSRLARTGVRDENAKDIALEIIRACAP